MKLSSEAIRVLGVLIEKESTTPDNYPLTLNSLVLGCNQTTNRDPIVKYDEMTVERGLTELRDNHLALRGVYAGSRVPKHRHCFTEVFNISKDSLAVMAVLFLRGEQTLGEIKQRTERTASFNNLDDVNTAIDELEKLEPPLITRLEKTPGHKEPRIKHNLLNEDEDSLIQTRPSFKLIEGEGENYFEDENFLSEEDLKARVDRLEKETTVLTHEIMSLRAEIDAMRDPSA
ncbi:MAG: YceH family protein [Acidimicrobiia bacterium]